MHDTSKRLKWLLGLLVASALVAWMGRSSDAPPLLLPTAVVDDRALAAAASRAAAAAELHARSRRPQPSRGAFSPPQRHPAEPFPSALPSAATDGSLDGARHLLAYIPSATPSTLFTPPLGCKPTSTFMAQTLCSTKGYPAKDCRTVCPLGWTPAIMQQGYTTFECSAVTCTAPCVGLGAGKGCQRQPPSPEPVKSALPSACGSACSGAQLDCAAGIGRGTYSYSVNDIACAGWTTAYSPWPLKYCPPTYVPVIARYAAASCTTCLAPLDATGPLAWAMPTVLVHGLTQGTLVGQYLARYYCLGAWHGAEFESYCMPDAPEPSAGPVARSGKGLWLPDPRATQRCAPCGTPSPLPDAISVKLAPAVYMYRCADGSRGLNFTVSCNSSVPVEKYPWIPSPPPLLGCSPCPAPTASPPPGVSLVSLTPGLNGVGYANATYACDNAPEMTSVFSCDPIAPAASPSPGVTGGGDIWVGAWPSCPVSPSPTPSAGATTTASATASASLTSAASASASLTGATTATPSMTMAVSATASVTGPATATATATGPVTFTASATGAAASASQTGAASASAPVSATRAVSPSASVTSAATATASLTSAASVSASLTGLASASASLSGAASASQTQLASATASVTGIGTRTASRTSAATETASLTAATTASASLTGAASATASLTDTATASASQSGAATASGSVAATASRSAAATASASPSSSPHSTMLLLQVALLPLQPQPLWPPPPSSPSGGGPTTSPLPAAAPPVLVLSDSFTLPGTAEVVLTSSGSEWPLPGATAAFACCSASTTQGSGGASFVLPVQDRVVFAAVLAARLGGALSASVLASVFESTCPAAEAGVLLALTPADWAAAGTGGSGGVSVRLPLSVSLNTSTAALPTVTLGQLACELHTVAANGAPGRAPAPAQPSPLTLAALGTRWPTVVDALVEYAASRMLRSVWSQAAVPFDPETEWGTLAAAPPSAATLARLAGARGRPSAAGAPFVLQLPGPANVTFWAAGPGAFTAATVFFLGGSVGAPAAPGRVWWVAPDGSAARVLLTPPAVASECLLTQATVGQPLPDASNCSAAAVVTIANPSAVTIDTLSALTAGLRSGSNSGGSGALPGTALSPEALLSGAGGYALGGSLTIPPYTPAASPAAATSSSTSAAGAVPLTMPGMVAALQQATASAPGTAGNAGGGGFIGPATSYLAGGGAGGAVVYSPGVCASTAGGLPAFAFTDPSTGVCLNASAPVELRGACAFYQPGAGCVPCPRGALCPGFVTRALVLPGYWSASPTSRDVQRCRSPAALRCIGYDPATGAARCGTGYRGAYCDACASGYYLDTSTGACVACDPPGAALSWSIIKPLLIAASALVALGLSQFGLVVWAMKKRGGTLANGAKRALQFTVGAVAVLQIVVQTGRNLLPLAPAIPPALAAWVQTVAALQAQSFSIHPQCLLGNTFSSDYALLVCILLLLTGLTVALVVAARREARAAAAASASGGAGVVDFAPSPPKRSPVKGPSSQAGEGSSTPPPRHLRVAAAAAASTRVLVSTVASTLRRPSTLPLLIRLLFTTLSLLYGLGSSTVMKLHDCVSATMPLQAYRGMGGDGSAVAGYDAISATCRGGGACSDAELATLVPARVLRSDAGALVCYEGPHAPVAALATAVAVLYLGLFPAATLLWVKRRLAHNHGVKLGPAVRARLAQVRQAGSALVDATRRLCCKLRAVPARRAVASSIAAQSAVDTLAAAARRSVGKDGSASSAAAASLFVEPPGGSPAARDPQLSHFTSSGVWPSFYWFRHVDYAALLALAALSTYWGAPTSPARAQAKASVLLLVLGALFVAFATFRPHVHELRWMLAVQLGSVVVAGLAAGCEVVAYTAGVMVSGRLVSSLDPSSSSSSYSPPSVSSTGSSGTVSSSSASSSSFFPSSVLSSASNTTTGSLSTSSLASTASLPQPSGTLLSTGLDTVIVPDALVRMSTATVVASCLLAVLLVVSFWAALLSGASREQREIVAARRRKTAAAAASSGASSSSSSSSSSEGLALSPLPGATTAPAGDGAAAPAAGSPSPPQQQPPASRRVVLLGSATTGYAPSPPPSASSDTWDADDLDVDAEGAFSFTPPSVSSSSGSTTSRLVVSNPLAAAPAARAASLRVLGGVGPAGGANPLRLTQRHLGGSATGDDDRVAFSAVQSGSGGGGAAGGLAALGASGRRRGGGAVATPSSVRDVRKQ